MIDMTFQLIAFFMILINFGDGEQDQRVQLPSSAIAKPPQAPLETPITIQMVRDGKIIMNGQLLNDVNADSPVPQGGTVRPQTKNQNPKDATIIHSRPQRPRNGPRAADHQGLPGNRIREVHPPRQIGAWALKRKVVSR